MAHQSTRYQADPSLLEVLEALAGLRDADIERRTGVSRSTIRKWRLGQTLHPQNITLEFALRAAGLRRVIVPAAPASEGLRPSTIAKLASGASRQVKG